jgi:hypothetical protein
MKYSVPKTHKEERQTTQHTWMSPYKEIHIHIHRHTEPLPYPTELNNPSIEYHVTRYCIPTKAKRPGSPQKNRVREEHKEII